MKKQGLSIDALFELTSVAAPVIHPDGNKIVYNATTLSKSENKYFTQLYAYDRATKQTEQLTEIAAQHYAANWSPDGTKLLFLSTRNEVAQLFMLTHTSGEARQLTFGENAVSSALWSPDSKTIYFTTKIKDVDAEKTLKPESDAITARVIEDIVYRKDGIGYIDTHSHTQIFALSLETKKIRQLTFFNDDCTLCDIHPDGTKLLYRRATAPNDAFDFNTGIYELTIETAQEVNVTATYQLQAFTHAYYSPDGLNIALLGTHLGYNSSQVLNLYVYHTTQQEIRQLFGAADITLTDFGSGDFIQKSHSQPIVWKNDGTGVFIQTSNYGRVGIYEVNLDDSYHIFLEEMEQIFDFTFSADQQTLVAAITNPTMPNNIFVIDCKTKERQCITAFNDDYLADKILSAYQEVTYKAEDGGVIHGFLVKPVAFQADKKYPLIYNIHGGPHVMHAASFFHEVQVMAARGYAVLLINPRGSHGYGQAHTNGVLGKYGAGDYTDLMSALDNVITDNNWIDVEHLHVTGGSYGGFMTNWIVTQTNRFRSAATQRSYCNVLSKGGCSDIGYYYTAWEMDTDIMDFEKFWKHSPLAYVKNVQTPLLFIHSENDYRCPISEAEQFFTYLKILKQKTKFYRFPDSSHGLSRIGIPSLRAERLTAIMEWFEEN